MGAQTSVRLHKRYKSTRSIGADTDAALPHLESSPARPPALSSSDYDSSEPLQVFVDQQRFYDYSDIKDWPLTQKLLIRRLTVGSHSNQPLDPGVLPPGLTHLVFGANFNQPVTPDVLPTGLTHLTFGLEFNQPLTPGVLPEGLTHLTFGKHFNQPLVSGILSAGLLRLTFGRCFNKPLNLHVLPTGLTHLTFGYLFNRQLAPDVFHEGLTHLTFGQTLEQAQDEGMFPIAEGVLPWSLMELIFENERVETHDRRVRIDI